VKLLKLLVASVLLTGSLVLAAPPSATAYTSTHSMLCTYYSDATYTTVIGSKLITCSGKVYSSGASSLYKECVPEEICGAGA
jgi:hypothetical protein